MTEEKGSRGGLSPGVAAIIAAIITAIATLLASRHRANELSDDVTELRATVKKQAVEIERLKQQRQSAQNPLPVPSTDTFVSADPYAGATPVAIERAQGFSIGLLGCHRGGGGSVTCEMLVKNEASGKTFELVGQGTSSFSSRLFDDKQRMFRADEASVANVHGRHAKTNIPPGRTLRAAVTFESLPIDFDTITLLEVTFYGPHSDKVSFHPGKIAA